MNHKAATRLKWVVFGAISIPIWTGGLAWAGHLGECPDREGHEVPTPFAAANQKFEMADGESYVLWGQVVFINDVPHLKGDLELAPWLATVKRKAFPFYRLEGSARYWQPFEGEKVRVWATARGRVVSDSDSGKSRYDISLRLMPRTTATKSGGS